jgi:hypothetical protein
MTIPALLVLSSLIGASVAYAARIQIRTLQRAIFSSRYFMALMMFGFAILLPVGVYFYAFYSDWSWMYLADTSQMSGGIVVMAMASYPIAAIMSYLVGYFSARGNSDWVTLMFLILMVVGLIGLVGVASDKLFWVGTYEQYHRNTGLRQFTNTSLFPSSLLALSGICVCWFYILYRFIQEGRMSLRSY